MPNKKWTKKKDVKSNGKKMGVVIVNGSGREKTLLNPHGKFVKYSTELSEGRHLTNDMQDKTVNGHAALTPEQAAFRAGYRSAVIDQTKAYKAGGKK